MTTSKLKTVDPGFEEKVVRVLFAVEKATGVKWGVTAGLRSMAEQKTLYAQGRTTPGDKVTNAPAGSSAHNFGLAVDIWPLKANGEPDWNTPAYGGVFKTLADIAGKEGLIAGYYFKSIHDAPHLEDPTWKQKQALWKEGKLTVA